MKKLFGALAAALVLGASPVAGAAVVNFDNPSLIEIDNDSGRAVYREAGFRLDGEAAGFLTIDGLGSAFSGGLVLIDGSTVSLMANNGSAFSFSRLVAGAFDPLTGASLSITGIFGDSSQRNLVLALGELSVFTPPIWTGLTELRFAASGDLVLDDIAVDAADVPEPGSIAMLLLGMGMLAGVRRRAVRKAS